MPFDLPFISPRTPLPQVYMSSFTVHGLVPGMAGDFLQVFGADGRLQYLKEMDPQLHSNGPCLSSAEYTAVTLDNAISSRYTIRGGRTDDLVRVYMDLKLEVRQDVSFSRLFFFQLTSETYSYRATHQHFSWGGHGVPSRSRAQSCTIPTVSEENAHECALWTTR